MRMIYKRAAAAVIAIALLLSASTISMGQFRTPSYIRVGLYYKDGSVNTALSIFDVSAAAGVQAGFFINDTFTEICREPSSATLYARKDTYFYNQNGTLKEYNPSSVSADSIASLTKYGPFHIKIGSDCPDQATAAAQAESYRQAGVQAYVAYVDAWQVWTGTYLDEAAARADIAQITPLLGEVGYSVVTPASNRIVLTNAQYQVLCIFGSNTAYFQLRPAPENNPPVISIKNKKYRGALEVRRLAASDMSVINYLSMQDYLYGCVPNEIGGHSPAEAIKAQAVAAKMYAINNMGKHSKAGFDVCPTTNCQVYRGFSSEVEQCNAAIDEVKDYVITYDGKLAEAIFYFASGGGRTEDVRNVWGTSYPYLVSVEDKYEKIYTWTKTLRASDIKAKIPGLGNILGVSILQTAPSGRVTRLSVRGDGRSDPATYLLEKCKLVFGLDSQLYTITTDADVYTAAFSHIPASVALVTNTPAAASSGDMASLQATSQDMAAPQDTEPSPAAFQGAVESQATLPAMAASQTAGSSPASQTATLSQAAVSPGLLPDSSIQTLALASSMEAASDTMTGSGDTAANTDNIAASPSANQPAASNSVSSPSTQAVLKLSIPMPATAAPVKTQLGGMKVASATGIASLRTTNNKITVLGAGGVVRTATLIPETYTFTGKGWGHAVGMSQEGAIGMGKAGISFDQILTHYFQGTKVEKGYN